MERYLIEYNFRFTRLGGMSGPGAVTGQLNYACGLGQLGALTRSSMPMPLDIHSSSSGDLELVKDWMGQSCPESTPPQAREVILSHTPATWGKNLILGFLLKGANWASVRPEWWVLSISASGWGTGAHGGRNLDFPAYREPSFFEVFIHGCSFWVQLPSAISWEEHEDFIPFTSWKQS